ncbi:MAG TPA: signal recognition particle-docking protein FtsY [Candidatus Melainabacteria bacterium]|nr:signal recognition particle-docking protein FtsY [Candidatus Melainabacteria bacterium]HIN65419.1 signal recognition particle-docking protein FtsY [Candidatus Obscuribacterales bacterium]
MDEEDKKEKSGFWGSTLSKLKSALKRTRHEVVDDVLERESADDTEVSAEESISDIQVSTSGSEVSQNASGTNQNVSTLSKPQSVSFPPPRAKSPPRPIDNDYLEELEEKLIKADIGVKTAETMVEHLRKESRGKNWMSNDVEDFLKAEFAKTLKQSPQHKLQYKDGKLNLYLIVGVNGTGKTTSIGKLCYRFKSEGKKVLVAAADTFRAAAESQLEIWADRAQVDICRLPDGSDPGAVVFQALNKAKEENYDIIIIDTAGRLHNKANLMAELGKIRGVIEKHGKGLPLEALLVLDASTGQNGMKQAEVFTEVCPLTGVILTKLDGTAKGGIVFGISSELNIPVKLIGLGEKMDDLRDFEPELFVEALFG